MDYNKLAKEIHETAREKGWWDKERNPDEVYALIVTELSEAIEADREDRRSNKRSFLERMNQLNLSENDFKSYFKEYIKDSKGDELADAFIRCLDWLYFRHREYIIIPTFEIEVPDNFAEGIFWIMKRVTDREIADAARCIIEFCEAKEIDLEWHVEQKMKYNGIREYKHGNKKY